MAEAVRIEEAVQISDRLVAGIGRLVAQLSSSAPAPSARELGEIASSSATHLLIARDVEDAVVGMLTLALYRIPTGVCGWIEDVVVDEQARGRGIGQELTNTALRLAHEHGVRVVDLTSRPSREAANRLYQRMGFVARETNIYRFQTIEPRPEAIERQVHP